MASLPHNLTIQNVLGHPAPRVRLSDVYKTSISSNWLSLHRISRDRAQFLHTSVTGDLGDTLVTLSPNIVSSRVFDIAVGRDLVVGYEAAMTLLPSAPSLHPSVSSAHTDDMIVVSVFGLTDIVVSYDDSARSRISKTWLNQHAISIDRASALSAVCHGHRGPLSIQLPCSVVNGLSSDLVIGRDARAAYVEASPDASAPFIFGHGPATDVQSLFSTPPLPQMAPYGILPTPAALFDRLTPGESTSIGRPGIGAASENVSAVANVPTPVSTNLAGSHLTDGVLSTTDAGRLSSTSPGWSLTSSSAVRLHLDKPPSSVTPPSSTAAAAAVTSTTASSLTRTMTSRLAPTVESGVTSTTSSGVTSSTASGVTSTTASGLTSTTASGLTTTTASGLTTITASGLTTITASGVTTMASGLTSIMASSPTSTMASGIPSSSVTAGMSSHPLLHSAKTHTVAACDAEPVAIGISSEVASTGRLGDVPESQGRSHCPNVSGNNVSGNDCGVPRRVTADEYRSLSGLSKPNFTTGQLLLE
ncbi:hypothetical protein BDZ89DRAFT_1147057 [Hymenopellis radicata]|nr:hypothetical protein BDZ89DRAFT_1147057 [Hymenopellis radicata]